MRIWMWPMMMALGACASLGGSEPPGPAATDLQRLIAEERNGALPTIRNAECRFIAEEGSEWTCAYQEQAADGRWVPLTTGVARDAGQWVLTDGVMDPNAPP